MGGSSGGSNMWPSPRRPCPIWSITIDFVDFTKVSLNVADRASEGQISHKSETWISSVKHLTTPFSFSFHLVESKSRGWWDDPHRPSTVLTNENQLISTTPSMTSISVSVSYMPSDANTCGRLPPSLLPGLTFIMARRRLSEERREETKKLFLTGFHPTFLPHKLPHYPCWSWRIWKYWALNCSRSAVLFQVRPSSDFINLSKNL